MTESPVDPPVIQNDHILSTDEDPDKAISKHHPDTKYEIVYGQSMPCGCRSKEECSCNEQENTHMSYPYVYAIGRIQPRFPSQSVEKEYLQAVGRVDTKGQTDYEAMRTALTQRQNRYLVRKMCWTLSIEGLETYILRPAVAEDFDLLVDSLRNNPRRTDMDIVIGVRGNLATPEQCNGLMLPIVTFDQIYSFDIDSLIKSIPKPEKISAKQFTSTAEELLDRILQLADNTGATDEHRACNYLAVRYQAIYNLTTERHGSNCFMDAVEVRPSRLSGTRRIVDVIFDYRDRSSGVIEKFFVRVDVTEEFPYLVSPMAPFYDR